MARRKPQVDAKETLDTIIGDLVSEYGQQKAELDALKKNVDSLNAQLKDLMLENNIEEFSANGYKVKYSVSERETINELQLLDMLLKKHKDLSEQLGLVKTKLYVDFEAIEKETYNGNLSDKVLKDIGKCREVKEVVSLRLSKEKK